VAKTTGQPRIQTGLENVMKIELRVGGEFVVLWSNGAGHSTYKIMDDPGCGPHLFSLVQEVEYGAEGSAPAITDHTDKRKD
jgi:hypothetical protein